MNRQQPQKTFKKDPKKKYKVRLQLSYDGTDFYGWQKQKNGEPTIQGHLEEALSHLFKTNISVCGAGRTDRGVHAIAQQAHFWCEKDPSQFNLTRSLNSRLTPDGMSIHGAWVVPHDFHALSSIKKTYKYYILNRPHPSSLRRNFLWHYPYKLDWSLTKDLSKVLLGTHDFTSFQNTGTDSLTTVKTLQEALWEPKGDDLYEFTITGDGFLRQMVRNIVGTLIELTRVNAKPDELKAILEAKDRQKAKMTAPPQGLFLYHVKYPVSLDKKLQKI